MSIIYDALKKVEKTNFSYPAAAADAQNQKKAVPYKPSKRALLLYSFAVVFSLFLGNIVYSFISGPYKTAQRTETRQEKPQAPSLPPAPVPAPKEAPAAQVLPVKIEETTVQKAPPPFALSGVFFSQDEGYALINNHIVKEGDVVGGATVKRINMDEVELVYDGSSIKLSAGK